MDRKNDEPVRYQQQPRLMRLSLSLAHLEHLGILQQLDKEADWRKGINLLRNVIARAAKAAAEGEK
jgi:hypothetical protein